ncbi:MAG: hypothetical protein ACE5KT_08555 [Methanosarcinales archaeon]
MNQKRKIPPHEPEEELMSAEDAIDDANLLDQILLEKNKKKASAIFHFQAFEIITRSD